jgi:hypothetical protein
LNMTGGCSFNWNRESKMLPTLKDIESGEC